MKAATAKEFENYGWHLLAADVASFTNISFYEVFERSAMEIFSTVMIMQAKIRLNENKTNR